MLLAVAVAEVADAIRAPLLLVIHKEGVLIFKLCLLTLYSGMVI